MKHGELDNCFTDFDTGTAGIADNAGSDPLKAAGMAVGMAVGSMPAAGNAHSGTYTVTKHTSLCYVGLSTRRSHNNWHSTEQELRRRCQPRHQQRGLPFGGSRQCLINRMSK